MKRLLYTAALVALALGAANILVAEKKEDLKTPPQLWADFDPDEGDMRFWRDEVLIMEPRSRLRA